MRIGLVTCRVLPEPDHDAPLLAAALVARGHTPLCVPWDAPSVESRTADVFLLRSPWNYYERPDDFVSWTDRIARDAPVINSPSIVRWNVHKSYLLRLGEKGVPIVPTQLVLRGESCTTLDPMNRSGIVVKPAVGAASFGVRRFGAEDSCGALEWLAALASRRDALVQPHLEGFREPGERSLIWIDGAWTHAVRKRPRFDGQDESVDASQPPTCDELAVAERALAAGPAGCRYARVDLVRGDSGQVLVSELELIEPSLYFSQNAKSLDRFVTMIEQHLCSGQ